MYLSACSLQNLVLRASGWSNSNLVKRLQAIRWNNDVKCASVSWIAPLHGRMGNYRTRESAVKSQEGKFARRKWYSASSLYRISCGHNLKFKRISTLWHGTPSTHTPPPPHTPAYAHRVALSHINILAWRCFIYWVAFALGWRSSFPLWLLGMPRWKAACLPDSCCLRGSSDASDSWHVAGATTATTCSRMRATAWARASYARPRDVYAIWVISAPRGSRNRPVAASLATRQHEIMLILTIKFEQPQLTSPLPSSSSSPTQSPSQSQSLSTSTAAAQSIAKRAQI